MDYKDMSLVDLLNLAKESSSEIGCMESGALIDYEVGTLVKFTDKQTALFFASARGIVLELCRRLQPFVHAYGINSGNYDDIDEIRLCFVTKQGYTDPAYMDESGHTTLTGKHLREAGMIPLSGGDA